MLAGVGMPAGPALQYSWIELARLAWLELATVRASQHALALHQKFCTAR